MKYTMRYSKDDTFGLGPKMDKVKRWIGDPPTHCDVCKREIKDNFVDGRMRGASWANMCMPCHAELGVGLGLGKGQYYTRKGDEWIKVAG